MAGVLMSIKPQFVRQIADGTKRVELRRMIPKRRFERVAVYESAPTSKVVCTDHRKPALGLSL